MNVDPQYFKDIQDQLLAHEIKNIAFLKLLTFVKRAANNSCCICCDECLSCDAQEFLRELGEDK